MSVTISLKRTMARSTDAVLHLTHHSLIIAGLVLAFGLFNVFNAFANQLTADQTPDFSANSSLPHYATTETVAASAPAVTLTPRMQGALEYVTRRYRVSPDALIPLFEVAQTVGQERHIDPLLIIAVIGIESGFNPFAESPMGAQGLMQVIPRYHPEKLPEGQGDQPLLDPSINIRVGVEVLQETIRRRGSLIAGLQSYAGSTEPEGLYANKVLAEKERLEQAARRNAAPNA